MVTKISCQTSIPISEGINNTNSLCKISANDQDQYQGQNFSVIWHNLSYKVDNQPWYLRLKSKFSISSDQDSTDQSYLTGQQIKTILDGVSGSLKAGQITAILGPSGAGKSSLLKCLFQSLAKGVTGSILCEGRPKSKLKICFIPQKDYLIEYLTVREDLMFVSELREANTNLIEPDAHERASRHAEINNSYLQKNMPDDRKAKVLSIAEQLGLTSCLDVKIGRISGGQQKRLSIAREIMSNPDILILDEPTTGLDSLSCIKTVQVLKDLAMCSVEKSKPMAIVLVIHQPQTEVFNLFDRVYFLSKYGRVIYDNDPRRVVDVLDEVSGLRLPSLHYNPASFMIEIASGELGDDIIDKLAKNCESKFESNFDATKLKQLQQSYRNRKDAYLGVSQAIECDIETNQQMNEQNDQKLCNNKATQTENLPMAKKHWLNNSSKKSSKYFVSYQLKDCLSSHPISLKQSFKHTFVLIHRSWLALIRNPSLTNSRLLFHILGPLIMIFVYGFVSDRGAPNACPHVESEIDIANIKKNIDDGLIVRLQEEVRLSYENIAFFFIMLFSFSLNVITITSSIYPTTMQMFTKEVINGLYKSNPYLVAQTIVEFPLEIIMPTISVVLVYHITGQPSSFLEWRMFGIATAMVLSCYYMHGVGLFFGALFVNNVNASMLLAQAATLPLAFYSGLLVRTSRMGYYARIFSYFSPYKHGLEVITVSRYGFGVCTCDEDIDFENPARIRGMTPQVKNVLDYMFPKSDNSTEPGNQMSISANYMFDKLGLKYIKAQTFALDLKSCEDVKPFVMHTFQLSDSDLFRGIFCLIIMTVLIKLLTFSIARSLPYRMRT